MNSSIRKVLGLTIFTLACGAAVAAGGPGGGKGMGNNPGYGQGYRQDYGRGYNPGYGYSYPGQYAPSRQQEIPPPPYALTPGR